MRMHQTPLFFRAAALVGCVAILLFSASGASGSPFASAVGTPGTIREVASTYAKNNVSSKINLPVPAPISPGDVLVAIVDVLYSSSVTPPAGWTPIRNDVNVTGNHLRQAVYFRVVTGGEPASYTW